MSDLLMVVPLQYGNTLDLTQTKCLAQCCTVLSWDKLKVLQEFR